MSHLIRISLATCLLLASTLTFSADQSIEKSQRHAVDSLAIKVEPFLVPHLKALREGKATNAIATRGVAASLKGRLISNDPIRLPITLDVPAMNADSLTSITATGARIVHSSARWNSISVAASLSEIDAISQLPNVRLIKLARRAHTRQEGVCGNQADADQNADQARTVTGVTGAGQKIGVLSNSCNQTAIGPGTIIGTVPNAILTGLTNQLSGDLPKQIQVIDFGPNDVVAIDGGFADEGSAMMELIHDIAPNASLVFASAYGSQAIFAENILKLGQAGCTVTCDDVGYFEEPFFQDGPIAQAIATNYAMGIPHFAATGNDYANGIMGTYAPVNPNNTVDSGIRPPNGDDFHNWNIQGTTPGFLPIDIAPGRSLNPVLQWNQPFQSYGLGPGASVDVDMYLFDAPSASANVLAKSENIQFGNGVPGGDPLEEFDMGFGYVNNSPITQRVYLAINHVAGSRANTFFRIVIMDRTGFSLPFGGTGAISIYGHTASEKCIGCAAIYSASIESGIGFGADSTHIHAEAFSSLGGSGANGIPFFFDTTGNAFPNGPQYRDKPDISAVDGCTTTFFYREYHAFLGGNYYPPLSNHFPSFFGTSAASPNAAAVAALLKERAPLSTVAQIKYALQSTARLSVLNVPVTPPDRIGAGLIDAHAAILTMPIVVTNPDNLTVNVMTNASFSITASGAATLGYQWQKNGAAIPGQNSATLNLMSVQASDDGSTYRCIVSNNSGTTASTSAVLHVNTNPAFDSGPTANPAIAKTGQTVTFTATASSALGQNVSLSWDFGDAASGSGTNVTHTFDAPGTYSITVTASDTFGLMTSKTIDLIVFDDSNNDGFPDLNPSAENSSYPDVAKLALNLVPNALPIGHLCITLNFGVPTGRDSIMLNGSIVVPQGFHSAGLHIVIVAGGLGRELTLDSKGRAAVAPNGSFCLRLNARKNTATYSLNITRASLKPFFVASGLTNKTVTNESHTVRVTLFLNGKMLDTLQPQTYSAKSNKTGKTK